MTRVGIAVALLAALGNCRSAPEQQKIPQPASEALPDESPGFAERVSLGSLNTRPSYPPADAGPLLTPEGDEVSRAVNAERARLLDAGPGDAGASLPGSDPGVGTKVGTPTIGTPNNPAEADPLDALAGAVGEVATLVFSAGVSGELVPCGCSPDLRGGLPRAASLLSRWRAREPKLVYLDAGDLLFGDLTLSNGPGAQQEKRKAKALAQGVALLRADARVLGARDLAAGAPFALEGAAGAPLLDAGDAVPGARETLLLKAGPSGVPIGFFAAGLGKQDPEKLFAARATDLRKQGARFVVLLLHPSGEGALAAAHKLLPAARAAQIDLVLLAHRDDPATDPDVSEPGTPPLLALEGHGQSLLRIDLLFPPDAKPGAPVWMARSAEAKEAERRLLDQRASLLRNRLVDADAELKPVLQQKLAELESRLAGLDTAREAAPSGSVVLRPLFRPLGLDLPDDPAAKALVAAYDKEVADANLAAAQKLPESCPPARAGEPSFIGVSQSGVDGSFLSRIVPALGDSCASCHPNQAAFWARTRHARAYESLVAKGKQFSFDCIACHTTGWQQPGGVCRIDRTEIGGPGVATPAERTGAGFDEPLPETLARGRQGVQCEDCHGPASEHARQSKKSSQLIEEIPESTCKRCHDFANSPHFDFQRYRPWVVGPGHGEAKLSNGPPRTRGELAAGNKLGPNPALFSRVESK